MLIRNLCENEYFYKWGYPLHITTQKISGWHQYRNLSIISNNSLLMETHVFLMISTGNNDFLIETHVFVMISTGTIPLPNSKYPDSISADFLNSLRRQAFRRGQQPRVQQRHSAGSRSHPRYPPELGH